MYCRLEYHQLVYCQSVAPQVESIFIKYATPSVLTLIGLIGISQALKSFLNIDIIIT